MFLLDWISDLFERAALRGIGRAVQKLNLADNADEPNPLLAIETRMAALPAPVEEKAPRKTK